MSDMTPAEEFHTSRTHDPVCPHCDYVDMNSWELNVDEDQYECGSCDKPFIASAEIVRYWTTRKIKDRP